MLEASLLAREMEPRKESEEERQIRSLIVKAGTDNSCHTDFTPRSETTLDGPVL